MKNRGLFLTTLIITISSFQLFGAQNAKPSSHSPYDKIDLELISGITDAGKIFNTSSQGEIELNKIELIYEAWANKIDNPSAHWNFEINKFKYHENKELYSKIRDMEYYVFAVPAELTDNHYDFDKHEFLYPSEKEQITINLSHRDNPNNARNGNTISIGTTMYFKLSPRIHLPVKMNEAKVICSDRNLKIVLLAKKKEWGTQSCLGRYGEYRTEVLNLDIIRAILVVGDGAKWYQSTTLLPPAQTVSITNEEKKSTFFKTDRFHDNGDDTITDTSTGLIWSKNTNIAEEDVDLKDARRWAKDCSLAGFKDWRIPAKKELVSLASAIPSDIVSSGSGCEWFTAQGFQNMTKDSYWSSTQSLEGNALDKERFFAINMMKGEVGNCHKSAPNYVWLVRGKMK